MKLPITLAIKLVAQLPAEKCKKSQGFLVAEIIIAFSLMTLFLVSALVLSTTMQSLHDQAVRRLGSLQNSTYQADYFLSKGLFTSTTTYVQNMYGNDSIETQIDPFDLVTSDYQNAWGADSCDSRFSFDPANVHLYNQGLSENGLGSGNPSTNIQVRDGTAYLTADSATASAPDLYVIDIHNPAAPFIISSLDTGPGLSSLAVAGHYIYATNTGSTNQLQVIDISNRSSPILVAKLKLPLPLASSTAPAAESIFYEKGIVYVGTEKWDGNEFNVIDVSVPTNPHYIGGFKTSTLISSVYARNGVAYLADADESQMRILDVSNPQSISLLASFSPSGWQTQEGTTLSYFEGKLALGRTTGGFNVLTNPEIFIFSTTSPPMSPPVSQYARDIPGGVYGISMRPPNVYIATRSAGHEFQVWDSALSKQLLDMSLGFSPQALVCDGSSFYFATGDQRGIAALTTQ